MGAFLDDGFYDHPKFENLSNDATALWARALAYCSRHRTDGALSLRSARTLARVRTPARPIAELVSARLWSEVDGGYLVHDYLDWNASRATREAALAASKERKKRWKEAMSERNRDASGTRSDGVGNAVPSASGTRPRNATPSQAKPSQAKPSQDRDLSRDQIPVGEGGVQGGSPSTAPRSAPTHAPASKPGPRTTKAPDPRACACPDSTSPDASAFLERWKIPPLEVDAEVGAFLDWHASKRSLFVNWTAAWRTWGRNKLRFNARGEGPQRIVQPLSDVWEPVNALDPHAPQLPPLASSDDLGF